MKNIFISIIILASLLMVSCEETVDNIDLPEVDKKLVLYSFITPGLNPDSSEIFAHLSHSVPYFGSDNDMYSTVVDSALIKLHYNNLQYQFTESADDYYLHDSTVFFDYGQTYRVTASADGYETVSAEITIPGPAPSDIKLISKKVVEHEWGKYFAFELEFTDIPGVENFYLVDLCQKDGTYYNPYTIYSENNLITDKGKDGKTIKIKAEADYFTGDKTFRIWLMNLDKHTYEYHLKLSMSNYDNPFSEPVIPYTNIENGLGVFGAYTKFVKDITVTHP